MKQGRLKHSIALVLVELHGLKFVNDSLGHSVGDTLLIQGCSKIK